MGGVAGPKKVRFLEDGTGNLHTSVFGESTESLGSLLDAHHDTSGSVAADEHVSIDDLISSLANYEKRVNIMAKNSSASQQQRSNGHRNGFKSSNGHSHIAAEPAAPALKSQSKAEPSVVDLHHRVQNFLDTFHNVDSQDAGNTKTVSPQNVVFHLEPDDPNSVDSGSVLSELDFEETSSIVTSESNKTADSLSSPVIMNRDHLVHPTPTPVAPPEANR